MNNSRFFMFWVLLLLAVSVPAFAADEAERYDSDQGVKRFGVTYNIASDRKIENVGGLHEPEGLDKYMKRLIEGLDAKITRLEEQSKLTEQKMDSMMALIQDLKQSSSQPQASPSPKIKNVFAR